MPSNEPHCRHDIIASILIAGPQPSDVDSHGGGRSKGSHITATFGGQLMVTMLDLDGAMAFAAIWTDPENRWVFRALPAEVSDPGDGIRGPSLSVRAYGADTGKVWLDSVHRSGIVRIGG